MLKIQTSIPRMISLAKVPLKGLTFPILERDLLDRLKFYSELLSEFEINLSKSFSGKVKLGEILGELATEIQKNKLKIIKSTRLK